MAEKLVEFMKWKDKAFDHGSIEFLNEEDIKECLEVSLKEELAFFNNILGVYRMENNFTDIDCCYWCFKYHCWGNSGGCNGCTYADRHGNCYEGYSTYSRIYYGSLDGRVIVDTIGHKSIINKIKELVND